MPIQHSIAAPRGWFVYEHDGMGAVTAEHAIVGWAFNNQGGGTYEALVIDPAGVDPVLLSDASLTNPEVVFVEGMGPQPAGNRCETCRWWGFETPMGPVLDTDLQPCIVEPPKYLHQRTHQRPSPLRPDVASSPEQSTATARQPPMGGWPLVRAAQWCSYWRVRLP